MEIENININDLKPAEYNPRTMNAESMKKLEKNINKFGLVDPIIINLKNNHIIGGHQRYKILKQDHNIKELKILKLGDIGWAFNSTDLKLEDETQEKALNLSLNKLDGEFDDEKLNMLFDDLENAGLDIELTGFNDYEVIDIQLNNFSLDLLEENKTPKKVVEKNSAAAKDLTININLYSERQKKQLTKLITDLKQKNPNKNISDLLLEYLENNIITKHKKINPYGILFENEKNYNKFKKLKKTLDNEYKQDSFINFMEEL